MTEEQYYYNEMLKWRDYSEQLQEACEAWQSLFNVAHADNKRQRDVLQALYDACDATAGTDKWSEYRMAIVEAEELLREPRYET